jgi:glycosyltransferase involved in cell wall biosynthesis
VIEALRMSGGPLLDQAHGGDPAQDPASCVRLMSAVDGVICDSSFICAELERLVDEVEPDWPLPPLHVAHPVPGAPELFVPDPGHRAETREELGFAPEDLVAFFPSRFFDVDGRLSERKRPEVAIDAFIAWASEEPRARFLAVGSPGFWTPESETRSREELGERLIRGGVLERTKMLNRRVSRAEMAALYRAADLTIVPSIEGFGLVYLESMACGTPLVAIDRGAVREVVGDGAEIVAADEPLAPRLARALGELGRDEGRREALAVAGLARAARTFRPGRWLDDVESIVLLVSET